MVTSIARISPEEARQLLAEGGWDLVDVREPHEWAFGRIPGSRHVPLGLLAGDPGRHVPRDRVIFVCAHGLRSLTAAALAAEAGRTELLSLDEGTVGWARRGFPLVTE